MTARRRVIGLVVLAALAVAVAVLRLFIDRPLDGPVALAWPEPAWAVYRYKALAAGLIVGTALATSGTLLQALLRNPLASPYILGISAGAGLGVMIELALTHGGGGDGGPVARTTVPALLGAIGTLGVVFLLSQRRGRLDPISLVLIGVVISTICGAGIMFCQHLVPTGVRGQFTFWLMGTIDDRASGALLGIGGGLTVVALLLAARLGRAMDAATLGDEEARSVGLSLGPLRVGLFLLAGALTAFTVVLAGPVAFVGLIAPHAARLVLGPRHGLLVIGAALAGVILVVGADVGRQAIDLGGGRMPIGIFTALIGGPAFIWLLLTRRGQA